MDILKGFKYSSLYTCKKWTLFSICLLFSISILLTVIIYLVLSATKWGYNKVELVSFVTTSAIFFITKTYGLIAVWKENFCLLLSYAIVSTIIAIATLVLLYLDTMYMLLTVVYALASVLGYLLAYDVHVIAHDSSKLVDVHGRYSGQRTPRKPHPFYAASAPVLGQGQSINKASGKQFILNTQL